VQNPDRPLSSFRDEDDPVFFTFLFLPQQFLVPVASLLILFWVPGVSWSFVQQGIVGQIVEVGRCLLPSSAAGFALGILARRFFPGLRSAGKWVGVLPSVLMVWALLHDGFLFSFAKEFLKLFFPGPDGEGWWLFMFLTCPTSGTLCYSAAMAWPFFGRNWASQL
jgi:hypothetical protein